MFFQCVLIKMDAFAAWAAVGPAHRIRTVDNTEMRQRRRSGNKAGVKIGLGRVVENKALMKKANTSSKPANAARIHPATKAAKPAKASVTKAPKAAEAPKTPEARMAKAAKSIAKPIKAAKMPEPAKAISKAYAVGRNVEPTEAAMKTAHPAMRPGNQ